MTDLESRLIRLEQAMALSERRLAAAQADLSALQQFARTVQTGGGGGGSNGGVGVYVINPVVIAAGGSVSGQTVSIFMGGGLTALPGTYTVYNLMASATVATAGKKIIVGLNPDNSFTAITQSC